MMMMAPADAALATTNNLSSNNNNGNKQQQQQQQQQQQMKVKDNNHKKGGAAGAVGAAGGGGVLGAGALKTAAATKDKVGLPLDVEMARQDALQVCNPDINRPFASLEDACQRLLPFHVLADYDADEVNDRLLDSSTGRVFCRSQLWNESLTAKINEFKSTLGKQMEAFNLMSKKRAEGELRTEERWMVEQFLLQEEKQKLIDIKVEVEARERAEREAEARMKEAIAQAERVRAEAQAQAQAEAHARAEAARMQQVQAEAARMQAHAEVARMQQVHAEAVRMQVQAQAQAEAVRMQVHAEAARMQAQGGAARMQVEPFHFVGSQMQAEDNTGLEAGSQEQDGMVDEMLESWEPLDEDGSDSNPDDLFNDAVHDQVGVDRGFHDMELLATNTMQGEWKEGGTLDLNSLNSR